MRREQLIRKLLKTTEIMVQGGLSETKRRCGSSTCICHRDPKRMHGPHLYITYRVDGMSRSLYVPPEHARAARQAQQAWASFWQIGCALAELNRDKLRSRWQHAKPKRKKITPGPRGRAAHD